jgi:hypothetical protein
LLWAVIFKIIKVTQRLATAKVMYCFWQRFTTEATFRATFSQTRLINLLAANALV